jgi:anti-anti-sigma factor
MADLEALIADGVRKAIVDCSDLEYISSYGIGLLLRAHKRLERLNGEVKLAAVQPKARQALELTKFDRVVSIHADLNLARQSCAPQAAAA